MGLRVGIVAGEASGDILGAEILEGLRQYYPDLVATGVAGPCMLAAGVTTLFPLEKLSVMGFSEVLMRAHELLKLRRQVKNYFLQNPPDVYIGIDAPDFNLSIELSLRQSGIRTVHYNSPTIWAWRKKRIHRIARSVDLMLTLFPFENGYYNAQHIPVRYIGHPLADKIPINSDRLAACQTLKLPTDKYIVALLPGSRQGEIKYIGPVLLKAAQQFYSQCPNAIFITPMVNQKRQQQFMQQWEKITPDLPLTFFENQSQQVMAAADSIVLASGTATLEGMLVKRPMVVVYRGSTFSYWIAKQLVTIKLFSLPNILAGEALIPEFIQEKATSENIVNALLEYKNNPVQQQKLRERFTSLHQQLCCDANQKAASAIHDLLQGRIKNEHLF